MTQRRTYGDGGHETDPSKIVFSDHNIQYTIHIGDFK
jgi:hypothetical protein